MSLEIIFGKNKTGKTKYLMEKYDVKKPNILFIKAEIDFDDVLKGNWGGTGKNAIFSPHKKIIDFLNEIFRKSIKVKFVDQEEYDKLIKIKDDIDTFKKYLENIKDDFFENCFKNSFETTDINNEFSYNIDLIKFSNEKRNGSSGSLNYSLIKLLYEMILDNKIQIENKNNEFILLIDEIEKFLHPELIFKIAHMIVKISEKINVILTTHSPLFLERIFYIHKNKIIKDDKKYCIKYSLKHNNNEIFTFDTNKIEEILRTRNYRTISRLSYFLFSSKCFFIEGIIENSIINDIINTNNIDKPYTIIDCNGKQEVNVMLQIVRSLSIIPYYQICLFYDSDSNKEGEIFTINKDEEKYICSIVNDPNIEESMFIVKDDAIEIKNFDKITNTDKTTKTISIKNFKKEKINKKEFFIFTIEWIKDNSTKPKNALNKKINKLVKQVEDFMSK